MEMGMGKTISKLITWAAVVTFFSLSLFPYIVKIGDTEISKNDFQEFVDVQKFIDNQDSFDELVKKKKTTRNNILTDYIDQIIVVQEARKKGYTEKNDLVKEAYAKKKERWVTTLYIAKNVDIDSLKVSESDMQRTYRELPQQSRSKPYDQLTEQEKQGLYQIATIKAAQEKKKDFQKVLEKKYSVKRYGENKRIVAEVEGKRITSEELQSKIDEQLSRLGVSEKEIVARSPQRFEEARKDILDEIIFEELVNIDIEKSNFLKNKLIEKAYGFLMDQVISEQYILNEIASKMSISSRELDEAFIRVSQQNPAIKNMLPTEQERLLKSYIIQAKLPDIIRDYLVEVKESIVIKRNKEELKSVW